MGHASGWGPTLSPALCSTRDERLKEGEGLPSEMDASALFGVPRTIVHAALLRLRRRSLVHARQGHGTYVMRRATAGRDRAAATAVHRLTSLRSTYGRRADGGAPGGPPPRHQAASRSRGGRTSRSCRCAASAVVWSTPSLRPPPRRGSPCRFTSTGGSAGRSTDVKRNRSTNLTISVDRLKDCRSLGASRAKDRPPERRLCNIKLRGRQDSQSDRAMIAGYEIFH